MSSHSTHAGVLTHPPLGTSTATPTRVAWRAVPVGIVLVAVTVGLRVWNMDTTFETSDQAAMPSMICANYGVKWIFAHNYGPVLPVFHKAWAMAWCGFGWPYNETAARMPVALMGMALVGVSYLLLRKLHVTRTEACLGTLFVSVIPCLVVDSHYAWGDHGVWVLFGAIALWSMLAYVDTRNGWYLLASATALFAHCLSSLYAFALPLTLMAAWGFTWRSDNGTASNKPVQFMNVLSGYVLPCVLALIVIGVSWGWTGKGQIGHLLEKKDVETFGLHLHQIARLPGMWAGQFGLIFGAITAAAMLWVIIAICRSRHKNGNAARLRTPLRVGLIGIWAWMGLLPFVLIADWNATGYAQYYMFEVVYAASILGVLGLCRAWRWWKRERVALVLFGALAFVQLALASVDVVLPDPAFGRFTGIRTGWGDVRPDSGAKAAGWYIRQHVPPDALILTLHTNEGMEAPVAEYYTGRKVLAHYDLLPRAVEPLWHAMSDQVDVVIVEPRHEALVRDRPEWRRAFTATRDGTPVRLIYTRWGYGNIELTLDVREANAQYDLDCHPERVPFPMNAPKDFLEVLADYQRHIRELGAMRFESTLPGKESLKAEG